MKAFEQRTVSSVVVALNPEIYRAGYEKADSALLVVKSGSLSCRVDGGDPSETLGITLNAGDSLDLETTNDIKFFKAVRIGSIDAVIAVDFS